MKPCNVFVKIHRPCLGASQVERSDGRLAVRYMIVQVDDRIRSMNPKVPAHLNPFASARIDALSYQFVDQQQNWDTFFDHWQRLGFRGAIVGPCGHGKTTLLDAFSGVLQQRGFAVTRVSLFHGDRRFSRAQQTVIASAIRNEHVLLMDGMEQLRRVCWLVQTRFLWPRSLKMLITSHVTGLLPTLYEARTSPELLKILVSQLVPAHGLTSEQFEQLFLKHHGNLRMALLDLYDRVAQGQMKIIANVSIGSPNS